MRTCGIAPPSHRCTWTERANSDGYPEHFAREGYSHKGKAFHWAYVCHALVAPGVRAIRKEGDWADGLAHGILPATRIRGGRTTGSRRAFVNRLKDVLLDLDGD